GEMTGEQFPRQSEERRGTLERDRVRAFTQEHEIGATEVSCQLDRGRGWEPLVVTTVHQDDGARDPFEGRTAEHGRFDILLRIAVEHAVEVLRVAGREDDRLPGAQVVLVDERPVPDQTAERGHELLPVAGTAPGTTRRIRRLERDSHRSGRE